MRIKRIADTALSIAAFLGLLGILVGVAVAFLGVTPLVFRSGSMAPAIDTGDLAFARNVQIKDLKVGDIVSVPAGDTRVTHRVVAVEDRQLRLKGDANNVADAEPYVVASADKVFAHVPKVGYAIAWAMSPVGLVVSGTFAALLLFLALGSGRPNEPGSGAHDEEPSAASGDSIDPSSGGRRGLTAAIGAGVLIVASTTTLAFWTDSANVSSPVSSGTLTLHAGGSTDYTMPFSVGDLIPGDSVAQSLVLSNAGSIPLKWTATGKGTGELTTLSVQPYYGANATATNGTSNGKRMGSCGGTAGVAFNVTTGGTSTAVVTAPQVLASGNTQFCVKVSLDDTSRQWTKSARLEFTFNAKQVNMP